MPGAKWFPEARLNFAENLLRRGDQGDAFVFWDERGFQRRVSYSQPHERRVARGAGAGAARPAPGRPRRRLHPEHARDRHARARRAVAGHRLVVAARPISARAACSTASARSSRRSCSSPTATATPGASSTCSSASPRSPRGCRACARSWWCRTCDPRPDVVGHPEGGAARRMAAQAHARRDRVRAAAVRASGLHPVQLRHHRHAQVHRARRRRRAAAEPEDAQAAVRRAARRPLLLLLHHQLGGVEPALPRACAPRRP